MLLLAVIGDRTLVATKVRKSFSHAEFLQGQFADFKPDSINYQSISEFTGMPRESVRRKVTELMDLGWVRRNEEGFLVATRKHLKTWPHLRKPEFRTWLRWRKFWNPLAPNEP